VAGTREADLYRNVLVPVDGTPFGEHALGAALAVARRAGARLRLVHVHMPALTVPFEASPLLGYREEDLILDRDAAYVRGVLARLGRVSGLPVDARLLEGPVAQTLADAARDASVDLVVVSTHAHTGFSRLWHRGVAAYLTRHLSVPVLMVHASQGQAVPEDTPDLQHVLVPLAGSTESEQVLEHAIRLGSVFEARFTLLQVVVPSPEPGYTLLGAGSGDGPAPQEQLMQEAQRYLDQVAARLRRRGLDVETAVVSGANPARAITGYVAGASGGESRVDVIAMETRGLGGAGNLFSPSVAEQVVHDSNIPVLVHHTLAQTVPVAEASRERRFVLQSDPIVA
jgi:nucleotide-binding universal stress UspA family protein